MERIIRQWNVRRQGFLKSCFKCHCERREVECGNLLEEWEIASSLAMPEEALRAGAQSENGSSQ